MLVDAETSGGVKVTGVIGALPAVAGQQLTGGGVLIQGVLRIRTHIHVTLAGHCDTVPHRPLLVVDRHAADALVRLATETCHRAQTVVEGVQVVVRGDGQIAGSGGALTDDVFLADAAVKDAHTRLVAAEDNVSRGRGDGAHSLAEARRVDELDAFAARRVHGHPVQLAVSHHQVVVESTHRDAGRVVLAPAAFWSCLEAAHERERLHLLDPLRGDHFLVRLGQGAELVEVEHLGATLKL